MKRKSFAGKSIPVDFSLMSVRDSRIMLEIIEKEFSKAKLKAKEAGEEKIVEDKNTDITIPLRHLAKALDVNYTVSIEFGKIEKALDEIRTHIEALIKIEKAFFEKVKEENRNISGDGKKKTGRSVPLRVATGTEGAWPSP